MIKSYDTASQIFAPLCVTHQAKKLTLPSTSPWQMHPCHVAAVGLSHTSQDGAFPSTTGVYIYHGATVHTYINVISYMHIYIYISYKHLYITIRITGHQLLPAIDWAAGSSPSRSTLQEINGRQHKAWTTGPGEVMAPQSQLDWNPQTLEPPNGGG